MTQRPAELAEIALPGIGFIQWVLAALPGRIPLAQLAAIAVGHGRLPIVVSINTDTLRIARGHPVLRDVIRRSLAIPDGWPVAFFLSRVTRSKVLRVTGADITTHVLEGKFGHSRVLLVGANRQCHDRIRRLTDAGVKVVGAYSPSRAEMVDDSWLAAVAEFSVAQRIDIAFFAFGQPLQEAVANEYIRKGGQGICLCVGGSLDMFAGLQRRAPFVFRRSTLEWLWRLLMEPARLWRRYLFDLPVAVELLVRSIRPAVNSVSRDG